MRQSIISTFPVLSGAIVALKRLYIRRRRGFSFQIAWHSDHQLLLIGHAPVLLRGGYLRFHSRENDGGSRMVGRRKTASKRSTKTRKSSRKTPTKKSSAKRKKLHVAKKRNLGRTAKGRARLRKGQKREATKRLRSTLKTAGLGLSEADHVLREARKEETERIRISMRYTAALATPGD